MSVPLDTLFYRIIINRLKTIIFIATFTFVFVGKTVLIGIIIFIEKFTFGPFRLVSVFLFKKNIIDRKDYLIRNFGRYIQNNYECVITQKIIIYKFSF